MTRTPPTLWPGTASPPSGKHGQQDAHEGAGGASIPPGLPLASFGLQGFAHGQPRAQRLVSRCPRRAVEEPRQPGDEQDEPEIAHQSPRKIGFLLSRKAVVPSSLSADSKVIAWAVDSKASPADRGIWL